MTLFLAPAYNEELNILRLIGDLESRPELWEPDGLLILVDDGSSDDTALLAERHVGPLPVEVLRMGTNQGPGRAFDAGFRRALELAGEDEAIVTLESDTTSDLDAVASMIEAVRERADLVLASVHDQGGQMVGVSAYRQVLSRGAGFAVRRSIGLDQRTVSSFFRVYRASALRAAYEHYEEDFIREGGFACKAEILHKLVRLGARVEEIPVELHADRRAGESKLRVAPTMAGYARLIARATAERMRA